MYFKTIVRQIVRGIPGSGKRLGQLTAVTLVAACGTQAGAAASSSATSTHTRAIATTPEVNRLTPTVVAVSPGATIAWGFAVATAGMLETHVQFADDRALTR